MTQKRTGLGKGLEALIPTTETPPAERGLLLAAIERIAPNPRQPRTHFDSKELEELAASIREHGILQPLIVTRTEEGNYVLVAGERRLEAARKAGLRSVPVIVRETSDDRQRLELALIENVQRTDLNPLEQAEAYRQLAEEFSLPHETIAGRVGKSRAAVTNTLRLLKLPETVRQALAGDLISEGHARTLLALPTPEAQQAALQTILAAGLNVRQTEELVRKLSGQKPTPAAKPGPTPEISALEERLRLSLGTRVTLKHRRKGGSLTIHYYSSEELDGILGRLLDDPT
jgi:ParB family transcriptional regulator, chromosome partitioning protein